MTLCTICNEATWKTPKRHTNGHDSKYYKKKGVLQLALQLNFWVVKDICNSMYLYIVSVNEQLAWVVEL
jgi:hypothetical protein